ncbi:MAG: PDZ domain-containing protein [Patescibacteria group bacterium]|nr:PDZ domain-containing protein [Patescibacteria group bacterium]
MRILLTLSAALLIMYSPACFAISYELADPDPSVMQPQTFNAAAIDTGTLADDAVRDAIDESLEPLREILDIIHDQYYKDVNLKACVEQIAKSGVSACTDRYSFVLYPQEVQDEQESDFKGQFVGIGVALEVDPQGVRIMNVYPDSPAKTAGLLPDDIILYVSTDPAKSEVSWVATKDLPLEAVIRLIKGPRDTGVSLIIRHGDSRHMFTLKREPVDIRFVESKKISSEIGYVRIASFDGKVAPQFFDAVKELSDGGMKVLILDLRNNPGGFVESAKEICGLFAPDDHQTEETIIYTHMRGKPRAAESIYERHLREFRSVRLIILQNQDSASAAEITAGYLQANARALVIGTRSFGKGIMQELIPLLETGGELHLTVAEYYIATPKGSLKVNGIGITPDITVQNPSTVKSEKDDAQYQRAISEAHKMLR